jgi:hypothetical protein
MGTRHEPPPSSSKTTLIVLVAGALIVAGLVGWALTRTVEPSATTTTSTPVAETETAPLAAPDTAVGTTSPLTTAMTTVQTPTATAQTSTSLQPPLTASMAPELENPHGQSPEKMAVPRIAVEDLRAKMGRNAVVVIDVRDQGSYERAHVAGAMHIPLAAIEANLSQLSKDKPIVTYCT